MSEDIVLELPRQCCKHVQPKTESICPLSHSEDDFEIEEALEHEETFESEREKKDDEGWTENEKRVAKSAVSSSLTTRNLCSARIIFKAADLPRAWSPFLVFVSLCPKVCIEKKKPGTFWVSMRNVQLAIVSDSDIGRFIATAAYFDSNLCTEPFKARLWFLEMLHSPHLFQHWMSQIDMDAIA